MPCGYIYGCASTRELTLNSSAFGRVLGVSFLKIGDLLDSVSKDGKSGVVGGVRSLQKGNFWNHKDSYNLGESSDHID